jgi:hypothetical protein
VIDRYRIELTTAALKDLKGYRHASAPILNALARLEFDPECGHPLSGDLSGIRSLDISVKGSGAFRAAFEVDSLEKACRVVAVGPRDGFYEQLRRRMNG